MTIFSRTFRVFGTLTLFTVLAASSVAAQGATDSRYPCRAVHTFDFWVGTFDAMPWDKPNEPSGGQLQNTREYDGCVFVERWTSADPAGNKGMSIVFYDNTRKTWRMIWNDDSNGSSDFEEGSYQDGAMKFKGWKIDPAGNRVMAMNVLQNVSPGLIRHVFRSPPTMERPGEC